MFHDEADFHSQLIKLIDVAKVPVILTLSDSEVRRKISGSLDEIGATYEVAKYRYTQMDKQTTLNALQTISLFENQVANIISNQRLEEARWRSDQIASLIRERDGPQSAIEPIL